MSTWFRKIVLWLCVAAIPVQGWAAAAMLNCGPSHHRIAGAVQEAVHAVHSHADGRVGSFSLDHRLRQHQHEASKSAAASADRTASHADFDTVSKFKCSACAACCSAAAVPTPALSLDIAAPVQFAVPLRPSDRVLFLTCGTDRPPRSNLA